MRLLADDVVVKCSYEFGEKLQDRSLAGLDEREVNLAIDSGEGRARVYRKSAKLMAVKVRFYGETAKAEIDYYFDESGQGYLVVLSDYHYTAPVSFKTPPEVASLVVKKLMICNGVDPNYPNSVDLAPDYKRAAAVLSAVYRQLY